eukprot:1161618-Pelagomonas_calceolata.AAC.11
MFVSKRRNGLVVRHSANNYEHPSTWELKPEQSPPLILNTKIKGSGQRSNLVGRDQNPACAVASLSSLVTCMALIRPGEGGTVMTY